MVRPRISPSPRKELLDLVNSRKVQTRREAANLLGRTYSCMRYWLDKLASEGLIERKVVMIGRALRRIFYYPFVPKIYFRTQYGIMFYTEVPRSDSPDPIAEFRVTAVSDRRGTYKLEEFLDACIQVGVILSPQTYWIKQSMEITADERDEPIDVDELQYSVSVHKRLNYAERYAIFFKSKKRDEDKWRVKYPYWWLDKTAPLPAPTEGDYEYDEAYIKSLELKKVALKALKWKFNNERGVLEPVE